MRILTISLTLIFGNALGNILPKYSTDEVVTLLNRIKANCPPRECLYLGIGRSPSLFTTALRMQEGNTVIDLPLTNFRYTRAVGNGIADISNSLNSMEMQILFSHFDNYLGGVEKVKRIIVMDFSFQGASIAAAIEHLELYFMQHRQLPVQPTLEPHIFTGLKTDVVSISHKFNHRSLRPPVLLNSESLFKVFKQEGFDAFSPEATFDIKQFKSVKDYKVKWSKGIYTEYNEQLRDDFVRRLIKNEDAAAVFPISCAYYF